MKRAKRPKVVKVWLWTDEDGGLTNYHHGYFRQPHKSDLKGLEGYRPYMVELHPLATAPAKPRRARKEARDAD